MSKKLTIKEAEKLMRKYLAHKPNKVAHSIAVSRYAYQVAKEIKKRHPMYDINLREMRILGLLHDIGNYRAKWDKHAFEGGNMLRELGHHQYASKIEKHGPTHELAKHFKIEGDFQPSLIEEKILVYADAHLKDDTFVTPQQRFSTSGEKWERLKTKYPHIVKPVLKSKPRRIKIIKEVEKLAGGRPLYKK